MVLPQAMAWVQYWFRILSLKFCGKSKKICGDISPQSPAFCMYVPRKPFVVNVENWISCSWFKLALEDLPRLCSLSLWFILKISNFSAHISPQNVKNAPHFSVALHWRLKILIGKSAEHMWCEIGVYLSVGLLWKSDHRSIMLPFLREQTI